MREPELELPGRTPWQFLFVFMLRPGLRGGSIRFQFVFVFVTGTDGLARRGGLRSQFQSVFVFVSVIGTDGLRGGARQFQFVFVFPCVANGS